MRAIVNIPASETHFATCLRAKRATGIAREALRVSLKEK